MDALKAMTYQLGENIISNHQTLEKFANMVVYNTDFINDDIEKIPDAK